VPVGNGDPVDGSGGSVVPLVEGRGDPVDSPDGPAVAFDTPLGSSVPSPVTDGDGAMLVRLESVVGRGDPVGTVPDVVGATVVPTIVGSWEGISDGRFVSFPVPSSVGSAVTFGVPETEGAIDTSGGRDSSVGTLEGWSDPRRSPVGAAVVPSAPVGATVSPPPVVVGIKVLGASLT
jgi:hypothetical protein